MDRTVRVVSAPGGTVLLVNGANLSAHRTAGRGFVLALLSRTKLPPWLKEGLAQIVNSVEAQGDRLIVGKVQQDVRNHLALETLDQMDIMMLRNPPQGYGTGRFDEQPYLVNSRGNNVEVLVDGMVGTRGDIEQALRDEKSGASTSVTPTRAPRISSPFWTTAWSWIWKKFSIRPRAIPSRGG